MLCNLLSAAEISALAVTVLRDVTLSESEKVFILGLLGIALIISIPGIIKLFKNLYLRFRNKDE